MEISHELYVELLALDGQLTKVIATARKSEAYSLAASLKTCQRQVAQRTRRHRQETGRREEAQLELLSARAGRHHDRSGDAA